ncbi:MAG: methyltransferase [Candidatus Staskawiczbacteria bacterium]|nr:methyltransferase [Candidatus Staskawiczbacteria bacterium]
MAYYYDNKLEKDYSQKQNIQYRRKLGQFFTPFEIASFMADWVLLNKKNDLSILDPASGLGVFERAIASKKKDKKVAFDAWEIDENLSEKLIELFSRLDIKANVVNQDFFNTSWNKKYDGIIANPPYYKHHFIDNKDKIYQEICSKTYFKFSIQTNIYCWFLVKSLNLLKDGGRLAFIIPSEFLNANYGESIKSYLIQSGIALNIININFKENVFDNALTTSAIVLAEKTNVKPTEINFLNILDIAELKDLNGFLEKCKKISISFDKLNPKIKWRNYFNGNEIKKSEYLIPFSEIGRFSRGIATGSNEYFILTPEEKNKFNIPDECVIPCVAKSVFAKDIKFRKEDFSDLVKQNKKVYLFNGKASENENCLSYIKKGERDGINNRFLTKNRSPWYSLENREVSNIWVSVFGRKGIKFIWNDSNCKNLTCFHSFYPSKEKKYLDILFIYLNTDFAKKLLDYEKREYGDGLEKFEPNDINKSLVFNFNTLSSMDFENLKKLQAMLLSSKEEERKEFINKADLTFRKYYQLA